jgi:alpha-L-rhamnosidase
MRVLIDRDPFIHANAGKDWNKQGLWPCSWIACPDAGEPPFVTAYRRSFEVAHSSQIRIHVAADERYDLYLDGKWIGRGNERGAPDVWFYETYDLDLSTGSHIFVARVTSLGDQAAQAQMSVHPGFLLAAEGEWMAVLGTGIAAWEAVRLPGYGFLDPNPARWRGARVDVDGSRFLWGYENGAGQGWQPVLKLQPAMGRLSNWEVYPEHLLRPATLPPMIDLPITSGSIRFVSSLQALETQEIPVDPAAHLPEESASWTQLLAGQGSLQVPPHTSRRILIDLQNYYCAYSSLVTSGGKDSMVRIHWAEALFCPPSPETWFRGKGNRNEIDGKYFIGFGDCFHPDGGKQRKYDTLWWNAGRYIELVVQTAEEALTLEHFSLRETRYPLEMESSFQSSDAHLQEVIPLLVRGMQMCSNETFFDCPYYEELQYSGDTRLECLVTYSMTRDSRLARKALRMFDSSRLASGLVQSRYPSRVKQIIAPFALWWVMMVRDYAFWKDDLPFVRDLMPGVRATLTGFDRFIGQDGLLYGPEGWNTLDWVPEWSKKDAGVPPDGHLGASGPLNWQLVYTLLQGADLEERVGEPLLAQHFHQRAAALARAAARAFWDPSRGLFADNFDHTCFSEHSQCMALLSEFLYPGLLDAEMKDQVAAGLLADPNLSRTTIYFNHYLFETYRQLGRIDRLFERLTLWDQLIELGFKTPVEMPEPSRSDCHGWGSHPLFHYFATILGIRPLDLGFRRVMIQPQLGALSSAEGRLIHPAGGEIVTAFQRQGDRLHCRISLPAGLTGELVIQGISYSLSDGQQEFWL